MFNATSRNIKIHKNAVVAHVTRIFDVDMLCEISIDDCVDEACVERCFCEFYETRKR